MPMPDATTIAGRLVSIRYEPGQPSLTWVTIEGRDREIQLNQATIECGGQRWPLHRWLNCSDVRYGRIRVRLTGVFQDDGFTWVDKAEFFDAD
jgi:hypothetical protein